MRTIERRRFLGCLALASCNNPFASLHATSASPPLTAKTDKNSITGAVVAWEDCHGDSQAADLWTARLSEIDIAASMPAFNRIVIWDELFSSGSIRTAVSGIIRDIPRFYGFDCRVKPNGMLLHLDGANTLSSGIFQMLHQRASSRIAVIDLDSCGVTSFDWEDVLPSFGLFYDVVVGIAHGAQESLDWFLPHHSTAAFFCPSSLNAMKGCDFSVLKSPDHPSGYWERQSMSRLSVPLGERHWLFSEIEKLPILKA